MFNALSDVYNKVEDGNISTSILSKLRIWADVVWQNGVKQRVIVCLGLAKQRGHFDMSTTLLYRHLQRICRSLLLEPLCFSLWYLQLGRTCRSSRPVAEPHREPCPCSRKNNLSTKMLIEIWNLFYLVISRARQILINQSINACLLVHVKSKLIIYNEYTYSWNKAVHFGLSRCWLNLPSRLQIGNQQGPTHALGKARRGNVRWSRTRLDCPSMINPLHCIVFVFVIYAVWYGQPPALTLTSTLRNPAYSDHLTHGNYLVRYSSWVRIRR